ncbi:uncharacterized protein N7496_011681 [Penicillium cataractarum]|uniref:Rhodopsin domain-containing protein n=1 Tax=Penicillium cataractarum TaxID=2100454 RepID=A0A9W9RFF9_9EURO|nr:uncharacterized protein N7496_011681 [Penicillium cataractarum]KAJ5359268.1 hypothetical protein N7496_011681 [Penicillium cataractarum]
MVFAKLTYLFFYLRIFVSREFRIASWVCMGCACAYWVGSVLQVFLICSPFEKNWNPTLPGHCANQNVAFSTIGALNLFTDVMIILLPIRFIWKLQMSLGTKMALYGIFGLGALYVSLSLSLSLSLFFYVDFADLPYSMIWAAFWSVTEPAIAIANACAPMLLFGSVKVGYSTQPASGPILSKDNTFKQINEMDSEFPLTRIKHRTGSAYEVSLNDQSQDGRSQDVTYHTPRSVVGDIKGHL